MNGFFFNADNAYYIVGYKKQDGSGIYKVSKDFSSSEEIVPDQVDNIHLVNGNLFYIKALQLVRLDLATKKVKMATH
ncbi:MAG: hypothetical protein LBB91_06530 [Clostridiales bacterium]|jgi:hypothetical protein|nr:hypothetical protein [Clostridiales bacterium]